MSKLIKPYEISLWEDVYIEGDEDSSPPIDSKYEERKIMVIGSDKMNSSNRVFNPNFTENSNGEKTLEFSIIHNVYNEYTNKKQQNPFIPYLFNERKVKLKYDDEWFDFIIKTSVESSENTFTYTCVDANVLELSKQGYNLELATELKNNQGTVIELGQQVLKDTDWEVDVADCDDIKSYLDEPVYYGKIKEGKTLKVRNMEDFESEPITLNAGTKIYIFYSFIKDKIKKDIQLVLYKEKGQYIFDDNNVAISDNYITTSLNDFAYEGDFPDFFTPLSTKTVEYVEIENPEENPKEEGWYEKNGQVYILTEDTEVQQGKIYYNKEEVIVEDLASCLFTDFQFKRLVRKQKTVYDKITERVVDVYESDKTKSEIYHYIDTVYTTSDILTNYITNGSNFGLSVKDEITGWSGKVIGSGITLVAVPDIADIKEGKGRLGDVRNYLKLKAFENGDYIYNQGIENNGYLIQDFIKGEKYSFRIRAGVEENTSNKRKIIDAGVQLKAVVAGYKIEGSTYTILDDQIFFDFREATHRIDDITIDNGSFNTEKTEYLIDGIPQAPDITVYYKDKDHLDDPLAPYKWSEQDGQYVPHETDDLHFYRMDAECKQPLSDIQNNDIKVGIFIYNTGVKRDYYIESVQLFEYIEDANDVPMVIGNIPEGAIKEKELFYLKPSDTAKKEDIPFFNSQDAIEASIVESIKPKIDEKCLAVSMIEAKDSNYFDILQSLCERFECWLKFNIEREEIFFETSDTEINFEKEYYKLEEGNYIKVENPLEEELPNYYEKELSGRPLSKKVAFKKYIGKDNWAGFKYGINLSEIERTFTSDEIVTKLIVPMSVSEYAKDGFCSIQKANSNISKLGYILNFNYYIERGLLNKKDIENINKFYDKMAQYNDEIFKLEEELSNIELKITILDGKRTVFDEYVENAKEALTKAYEAFDTITGFPYTDEYDISQLPDKYDSLVEVTTQIAFNKNIINTYEPLAQKISEECGELEIKAHGCLPHVLTIDKVDDIYRWYLDDYVKGIEFNLEDGGGTIKNFVTTYFSKGEKLEQDFVPARIENIIFPKEYKPIGENPDYNPEIGDLSNRDYTLNIIPIDELSSETSLEKRIEKKREERDEEEKKFLKKYGPFIQEGTWNSDDYIDDELYYLDAVKAAYQNGKPKVEYSIKVIEVSQLEGLSGYDFRIGDKTYIEDTEFFGWITIDGVPTPIKEEVVISEFIHNLDDPTEDSITVKNYKTNFEDLFQRLAATTQTIQYNQGSYARAASAIDAGGIINPQVLLNSIQGLGGQPYTLTTNKIITVVSDGIVATDILDANRKIKLTSGAISTTTDNGENWLNVLTPDGLNAEFLRAGKINTDEITLGSKDNPSFRWDSSGLNAYRNDGINYNLNKFVRLDQYGLYGIDGDEFFKPTNINEIEENAKFGLTWKGFFLNSDHGAVKISNEDDIQVFNGDDKVKIHIGRIEEEPEEKYGIRINDNDENLVLETDDDGDLALAGLLSSISYKDNPSTGWAINGEGNAIFNNITARGAIKTAVFEYAEIQAVGGIFLFRPSSIIKEVEIDETNLNNLILKVENPLLFVKAIYGEVENPTGNPKGNNWYEKIDNSYQPTEDIEVIEGKIYYNKNYSSDSWCKVSNCLTKDSIFDPTLEKVNGLNHIYKIGNIDINNSKITLIGAAAMIGGNSAVTTKEELVGGSLVDMGREDKSSNYGIGVNSSDNSVALPPRAISLFETNILPEAESGIKVSYDYKGILGTLPYLGSNFVDSEIFNYMEGTQGIFTNNMYIGDKDQYLAFYTEKEEEEENKRLKIKAEEILITNNEGGYIDISNLSGHFVIEENSIGIYDSESDRDGYYTLISNEGISLNNGNNKAVSLDNGGLKVYKENANSPTIQLDNTSLKFFEKDNVVAELEKDGLVLSKGGIQAGSPNQKGFIYLSSEDYLGDITINNHSPLKKYTEVENPEGNPKEKGWYEKNEEVYTLTEDTEVQQGKVYYQDESDPKWRQIIGNKFGVDSEGNLYAASARIGSDVKIGNETKYHISLADNEIAFWSGEESTSVNKTAYITGNYMYIPYTVVLNEMRVGQGDSQAGDSAKWSWRYIESTENLRLVWLGGDGE